MTTKKNFFYFEDAKLSKTSNGKYRVVVEDDYTCYIDKAGVNKISFETNINENLIAVLLAHIDYARQCRNSYHKKRVERIDENDLIEVIILLLFHYSIEDLINKVKNLKWHEIINIINADNPIEEIERII